MMTVHWTVYDARYLVLNEYVLQSLPIYVILFYIFPKRKESLKKIIILICTYAICIFKFPSHKTISSTWNNL